MQSLGDYRIDDYLTFGVQLHRFSSGAVYAPTGNVTYTFYENNATAGAPTGGNLAQLNSKTGLYSARVQLTSAAGFEAGKEYFVHVEATVDSVAAGELFLFRVIANPKVDVDTIKTQTITCGAGVTVLASVGTAATSTAQTGDSYAIVNGDHGLVSIQDDVDTVLTRLVGTIDTGTHKPQSGDAYARLGSPAGVSVSADIAALPTAAANADAVWDEALAGHAGAGSTGAALSAAGSAGDPWSTALPGAYGAGTAGKIVGDNLNAPVGTIDTVVDAIKVKTDYLPSAAAGAAGGVFIAGSNAATTVDITGSLSGSVGSVTGSVGSVTGNVGGNVSGSVASVATGGIAAASFASGAIDAAALAADAGNEIADAILARNVSGGSSTGRTVKQALHFLRNKWTVSGGTLTVYDTDDASSSWTATVSSDAAAEPIVGNDPA